MGYRSETFYGRFSGDPLTRWLPDGRKMLVEEDLSFQDPNGIVWSAPRGSEVDGASIPRAIWSLVGGPLDGPYRNASIIHDVACVEKRREWQLVHRCFYNGMMAMGAMSRIKAKVMYAAVYHFGPRWKLTSAGPTVLFLPDMTARDLEFFESQIKGTHERKIRPGGIVTEERSPYVVADSSHTPNPAEPIFEPNLEDIEEMLPPSLSGRA
jgi:hypothetical protein